jgi:hypothetical protein
VLSCAAPGCGCSAPEEPSGTPEGAILLVDANNYLSTTVLTIPEIETAPMADLHVCWDQVVKDIQCHEVNAPVDVDNVSLLRFPAATKDQVAVKLGGTQLNVSDLTTYADVQVVDGSTCAQTGMMETFGDPINLAEEYVEAPTDTFMIVLTRGTTPGIGAATMVFIKPVSTSTNVEVPVPTGCSADESSSLLSFTADLHSLTPVTIPIAGPWVVDWSQVTRDGGMGDINLADIDRALVGFFQGKTVADLEANVLDLEYDDPVADYYTTVWEATIERQDHVDLAVAVERGTGAPFPGFAQTDGVWVLGLMCGSCQNPSPIILTVLLPS